jgi:hypothetical protein
MDPQHCCKLNYLSHTEKKDKRQYWEVALFGVLDGLRGKSVNIKLRLKCFDKGKKYLKSLPPFSYYQHCTLASQKRLQYSTHLQPGNRFWQSEEQRQNFSQKLELPMQGQVASQFCPKIQYM